MKPSKHVLGVNSNGLLDLGFIALACTATKLKSLDVEAAANVQSRVRLHPLRKLTGHARVNAGQVVHYPRNVYILVVPEWEHSISFQVGRSDVRHTRLNGIEVLGYKVKHLTYRRDPWTRVMVGIK